MLLALILASCGGGGGGGLSGTGGIIPETYYPTTQQSIWVYEVTDSSYPDPYINTTKITGTKSIAGVDATIFRDDNPDGTNTPRENYYYKDANVFRFMGNDDVADWIDALVVPYDEMRFDGQFGLLPIVQKSDLDTGIDLDHDGVNEKLDLLLAGTVAGYESLTTSAGTFLDASRLEISLTGALKASSGVNVPITQHITEWRAPGVGIVKQVYSDTAGGPATQTVSVRGYVVGGLKKGYLAPQTMLPNLVLQASSDLTRPGNHAIGSDGNNFLLVSRQETGLQITSPLSKWVGQIISADGTSQTPFDLSPSSTKWMGEASIAFDGTNYLVLTNEIYRIDGTPYTGIVAQRVSNTGIVQDAYPGLTISATGSYPSLAFGSGTFLAVFRELDGIHGALVSTSGVVGSEFLISTTTNFGGAPAVTFDGTNFLVVWETGGTVGDPSTTDIYGARISPLGNVIDSTAIPIATLPEAQMSPQVTCDGTNCLVVWIDKVDYPGTYNVVPLAGDVYASFISKDGVLLNRSSSDPGIPVSTGGATPISVFPGLSYTGSDYLIGWSNYEYTGSRGVFSVRMDTNGNITSNAVSASGIPTSVLAYVSIASGGNSSLITWLNNSELSGTSKSVDGVVVYP